MACHRGSGRLWERVVLAALALLGACEPAAQVGNLGEGAYHLSDGGLATQARPARPELDLVIDPPTVDQELVFGAAIGVAGSRLVAAAALEDVSPTPGATPLQNAGEVYAFRRHLSGWRLDGPVKRPYLAANNGGFLLSLPLGSVTLPAYAITVTDDELFIGQVTDDMGTGGETVRDCGAVHVYRRDKAGGYTFQQTLKAPTPREGDHFGYRMAVVGPWLAVSAVSEDEGVLDDQPALFPDSGAVHVFVRRRQGWVHHTRLTSIAVQAMARFGSSLAMRDDMLLVGAMLENYPGSGTPEDKSAFHAGSVHVFRRTGETFEFVRRIFGGRPQAEDWFGVSMAVDGNLLAIGATALGSVFGAPGAGPGGGRVLMFRWVDDDWQPDMQLVQPDPDPLFGLSLALRGHSLFVGAPREVTNDIRSGAVLVFQRDDKDGWTSAGELIPSDAAVDDLFGASLAISDTHLVVGAPNKSLVLPDRAAPVTTAGRVYVYRY